MVHGHWSVIVITNSANRLLAQLNHFRVNFAGLSGSNDSCIFKVPPVVDVITFNTSSFSLRSSVVKPCMMRLMCQMLFGMLLLVCGLPMPLTAPDLDA